jgi:hypothetical protein
MPRVDRNAHPHFSELYEVFKKSGPLSGDETEVLAAAAAVDVFESHRPQQTYDMFQRAFESLPRVPEGSHMSFESLGGELLKQAQRRREDPSLPAAGYRDISRAAGAAEGATRGAWALVTPSDSTDAIIQRAWDHLDPALASGAARDAAAARLGDPSGLEILNPTFHPSSIEFETWNWKTKQRASVVVSREEGTWKLSAVKPRSAKAAHVRTTFPDNGARIRYEPGLAMSVYDDNGVRTDRTAVEISHLTQVGTRRLSRDDIRDVRHGTVTFSDGTELGLYFFSSPSWSASSSFVSQNVAFDRGTTVKPILENPR